MLSAIIRTPSSSFFAQGVGGAARFGVSSIGAAALFACSGGTPDTFASDALSSAGMPPVAAAGSGASIAIGGASGSGSVATPGGASGAAPALPAGQAGAGVSGVAGQSSGGTAPLAGAPSIGVAGSGMGGSAMGGSGTGGSPVGGSSAVGGASSGGAGGTAPTGTDEMPFFSFFVTSYDGLIELALERGLTDQGFGGNLGGIDGADEICSILAKRGNPTDTKVWKAFLSTSTEDAIDRIGDGPWYDWHGRLIAATAADLVANGEEGRPDGDAEATEIFATEVGDPNNEVAGAVVDNHDTLTGSNGEGRLNSTDPIATCDDWTSDTLTGNHRIGHSWPARSGTGWLFAHNVGGCVPGVNLVQSGGASGPSVGSGGGFGGFYCFALGAVAP